MGLASFIVFLLAGQATDPAQIQEWVRQLGGPEDSDPHYRPYVGLKAAGAAAVPALIEAIRTTASANFLRRANQLLYEVDDERPARALYEAALRIRRATRTPYAELFWPSLARYSQTAPLLVSQDLESPDPLRRRHASELFLDLLEHGFRPGPNLRSRVVARLYDPDPAVVRNACRGVGILRASEATARLTELLAHPEAGRAAAPALAALEDPRTVPDLLQTLRWADYTAWNVTIQLRRFAKPEHLTAILRIARENPGLPRAYAINLAGYLRDASAIPDLQAFRDDPLERVRLAVENAIQRIQGILP